MFLAKNGAFWRAKIGPKKECLANACLNWLLVLYYGGSSLNGWGRPSGMETRNAQSIIPPITVSKWLGTPVGDGNK